MSKEVGYHFYDKKQDKFYKGDLILIPFGEKNPSVYQVISSRGKKLLAVVLEDAYLKSPVKRGTVCDLSKPIYEGFWCHRRIPNIKYKKSKTDKVKMEVP